MPDFCRRSSEIEIMDDLACKGEVVHQTLRELEFINRWLGGNAVTLKAVQLLLSRTNNKTFTLADLGCGGGDMLVLIADWARKKKIKIQLTGIDANPHIIEFAKNNCKDYPEISFEVLNIFSPAFQERRFDIITGTLFYHHFRNEELTSFFSKAKQQAGIGLVINDIHRHWLAYRSIRLLTQLFSRSATVKFDAPLSVLRAFSRRDLVSILNEAGILHYDIRWKWAFRWQVLIPA